jgi:hypothetical protein
VENEHRFDGTQKWLGVKVIISKWCPKYTRLFINIWNNWSHFDQIVPFYNNVKVKLSIRLGTATRRCIGGASEASHILSLALCGGECSVLRSALYPRRETPCDSLDRRLCGPKNISGIGAKI